MREGDALSIRAMCMQFYVLVAQPSSERFLSAHCIDPMPQVVYTTMQGSSLVVHALIYSWSLNTTSGELPKDAVVLQLARGHLLCITPFIHCYAPSIFDCVA